MKRVDFIGVPGVGKSTLFHRLRSARGASRKKAWLTPGEARRAAVEAHIRHEPLTRRVVWQAVKRIPELEPYATQRYARTLSKAAMRRATEDWQAFFDVCLAGITRMGKDAMETMEWLRVLYQVAYDVALMKESRLPRVVVFDESLTFRAFGMVGSPESRQPVEPLFERIPAPDAVIHCHAPLHEVVSRICERRERTGRVIRGHQDLSSDGLRERSRVAAAAVDRIVRVLGSRGVEVLPLDTTAPAEENARLVDALVRKLEEAR